jgi:aminomethyltransferase
LEESATLTMAKRTPFYDLHVSHGAKMVEFAGFDLPVQYAGIIEEHLAVRRSVGVFDVTHMGEFIVRGNDALPFLQTVTINDVERLKIGRVQYSAMCYEDGGIVDDLLIYRTGSDRYMLVVNAANVEKDFAWLESHRSGGVVLENISDETALLAVQGPKTLAVLQKLTKENLSKVEYYGFVEGTLAGVPMTISRTGYTGELGFELCFPASVEAGTAVWNALFDAGKEFSIMPVGLGARDTLRLEMGYCLYGNDIDQTTNPPEAGLGWITKLNKKDFIGKSALLKVNEQGLKRKLAGFTLPDKMLARHGYDIVANGVPSGRVTSGTFSPSLQKGIGLGYVPAESAEPETVVSISIRGKQVPATVVSLPFLHKR